MSISGTTITNVGSSGIVLLNNNNVMLNNSILAGTFGLNGIDIDGSGNTLNGVDNTAAGATFGGNLCEDNGNAWAGTIVFDGVSITSANCP